VIYGIADIVSDKEVIEVKRYSGYKHAYGQVHAYGDVFSNKRQRIHLFGAQKNSRIIEQTLENVKKLYKSVPLRITVSYLDENDMPIGPIINVTQ
jgi:hypothetical protein